MRRPLVLVTVAFLLGIVIYELGPWYMVFAFIGIGAVALIGPVRCRRMLCLALVVGLTSSLYTHVRWMERQHPLPVALDVDTLTVEGIVLGPPEQRLGGQRFLLRASKIRTTETTWSWAGTVQVTVSEPIDEKQKSGVAPLTIHGGEHLRLTGNWRLFGEPRNPGEPSWSKEMARRGINGSLWSGQDTVTVLSSNPEGPWWRRLAWETRHSFLKVYQRFVPAPYDALLAGLTLGVDDQIPEETVEDFQSAGVLHLLAVSGGNVAFIVGIALFVLRRVPIPLWLENLLLLIVIFFFALVTGAEASVVRASWMAGLLITARWMLRNPEFISVIALAVLTMLVSDPYALYATGFQLSFAAVIGLALWTKPFERRLGHLPLWVRRALAATLAAQLGVLPLSIYYFNQISLIAPLANLVIVALAVPVNILAVSLIVSSWILTPMAWVIGQWTSWLLVLMTSVAKLVSQLPLATLTIPSIGWLGVGALYLWLAWLSTKPWWLIPRQRLSLSLVLMAGIIIWWWHPWPYQWQVTVLDVGQGDAIFMRMPNGRSVLVDGGGRRSPLPETVGKGVVVPFLRRQGVQQLDLMIVSHPHEDHYRGLLAVTKAMRVKTVLTGPSDGSFDQNYQRWLGSLAGRSQTLRVAAGDQIVLDPRVSVEVLFPTSGINPNTGETEVNNQSLVLRFRYGTTGIYLTGDLEADGEEHLSEDTTAWDGQTVLKVGHHGSRNSTSNRLLRLTHPMLAVISVAENNQFGHPAPETISRLEAAGSRVLRTDRQGAVILTSDGSAWRVATMK